MPSDRTLQTRRTLPKAGHGGTPCQKAHGEYHNGEALATPGKKKSNFARPRLSNFAHSKSLTLRVGQHSENTPLRGRGGCDILLAFSPQWAHRSSVRTSDCRSEEGSSILPEPATFKRRKAFFFYALRPESPNHESQAPNHEIVVYCAHEHSHEVSGGRLSPLRDGVGRG